LKRKPGGREARPIARIHLASLSRDPGDFDGWATCRHLVRPLFLGDNGRAVESIADCKSGIWQKESQRFIVRFPPGNRSLCAPRLSQGVTTPNNPRVPGGTGLVPVLAIFREGWEAVYLFSGENAAKSLAMNSNGFFVRTERCRIE
jgi:hypothetical protein